MGEPPPAGLLARLNRRLGEWLASPAFLIGLLVCGVVYRCRQFFAALSYWYDEAFLLLVVRDRGYADLLGPQPYNLVIPPAFLWMSRALHDLFGDGELVQRLPAFAADLAALFVMIPLARRMVGGAHAVWPVALLAVCRTAVKHASEVRPYTVDLLVAELVLWCSAVLLEPATGRRARGWATAGLGLAAAGGVWLSFPSAFMLGGVSAAGLVRLLRGGTRREWLAWVAFNALTAASAVALWWVDARHMYYPGMIPHWQGWGGFPDWNSPGEIVKWLLTRPAEVGNYGTREMGWVLTVLAVVGGVTLWKRSPALVALLVTPFVLTVGAALTGKYPLAERTGFFLLPCVWLLAAAGVSGAVGWAERRGWRPALLALVLIVGDLGWLFVRVVQPAEPPDYRGAYQYVREQRQPDDLVWSHMGVVYEAYYGKGVEPLMEYDNFEVVVGKAKGHRMWVVAGDNKPDFMAKKFTARLEADGWRVSCPKQVYGLEILLAEPPDGRLPAP